MKGAGPVMHRDSRDPESAARSAAGARARSFAYALFSQLVRSPWESADSEDLLPPADLGRNLSELTEALPYAFTTQDLGLAAADLVDPLRGAPAVVAEEVAAIYGGLFEVGSDGPAIPLREGLAEGRPESTREEIVRYYEYFGYRLIAEFEWQPDHLSVELEFLHFLVFREAQGAVGSPGFCRGQLDFLERHPRSWVPQAARRLTARLTADAAAGPPAIYYGRLLSCVAKFLERDAVWQRSTLGGGS